MLVFRNLRGRWSSNRMNSEPCYRLRAQRPAFSEENWAPWGSTVPTLYLISGSIVLSSQRLNAEDSVRPQALLSSARFGTTVA
jgi:hypothetical protein